jgi:hypothetical protein
MDILLQYLTIGYLIALIALGFIRIRAAVISALMFVSISLNAIPWDVFQFDVEQLGVKLEALVLIGAFCCAVWEKRSRVVAQLSNPYLILCVCMGLLMAAYLTVSDFVPYGVEKTELFFFKCVAPVAVLCMLAPFSKQDFTNVAVTLIFTAFLIGINSFAHTDVLRQRSGDEMNLGSITIARIIGMGLFLVVTTFRQKNIKTALALPVSGVAAAILVYMFIPTGSRGPLASAIVASIPVFFFRTRNSHLQRVAVPCVVLFFIMVAFSYFQHSDVSESLGFNRLLYIFQDQQLGTSELARLGLQQAAVEGFVSSKGIGLGTGGFAGFIGVEREWPHNMPLEVLSEFGIAGMILFCAIMAGTVWRWLSFVRSRTESSVLEDGVVSLWLYYFLNTLVSFDINSNFGFWIAAVFPWLVTKSIPKPRAKTIPQGEGFPQTPDGSES